jgi:16S rRNA (cytosine967-C5)-methyltransferase
MSVLSGIEDDLFEEDRLLLLVVIYLYMEGKLNDAISNALFEKLKSKRLAKKVPQILARFLTSIIVNTKLSVEKIGVTYSFPDWIVERFIKEYGEDEARLLCASLNEQAPLTLRVNTLKATVEKCQAKLGEEGVETTRTILSPFGLNIVKRINVFSKQTFRNGWFEVQDEGSQLLPLLVDPKPTAKLLDVCAGAGGKTLEFAALMKNRGSIYATDINGFRLEELRKRVKRASAQNIRVQVIKSIEDITERFKTLFDIVFIDAPCSGLGTIRRNPGMKWTVREQTVNEVSEKQRVILQASAQLVKVGGRLVYATCTLLKQENEDVIEDFLSRHLEFEPVDACMIADRCLLKANIVEGKFIKFLPHIHRTDGFFLAVLEKKLTN